MADADTLLSQAVAAWAQAIGDGSTCRIDGPNRERIKALEGRVQALRLLVRERRGGDEGAWDRVWRRWQEQPTVDESSWLAYANAGSQALREAAAGGSPLH